MQLSRALRVRSNDVVGFVGAGGKTSAMFRLGDELAALGRRVVVSTTTRLAAAQVRQSSRPFFRYESGPDFVTRIAAAAATGSVTVVGEDLPDDKVGGVPPAFVDQLARADGIDIVVYEADGARMLAFKAPAAHEPALASSTRLVVPVIGITAIGAPLDDAHVHRAEIAARLAGARIGEPVTPTIAARVLTHPEGGLKGVPAGARVAVLINQVNDEAQLGAARALARLLLGYREIESAAVGAVREEKPVRETRRRVAAVVLAAGGGTRMEGRIKQLLPWRGKTLIENALEVAAGSSAVETIVVLGACASEIRGVIQNAPARIALNRDWESGHASSIRAGLGALARQIDAAIFVNADQPFLTGAVVDAILQRYYETDASIVAPLYANKRGSPVLFDRIHFDELTSLQGEQGGRDLLARHRDEIEFVEFADARMALDVDTPEEYRAVDEFGR